MPYADLTAAVQSGAGEGLYLPNDSHWNAAGHRLVAERLVEFIRHDLDGEARDSTVAPTPRFNAEEAGR